MTDGVTSVSWEQVERAEAATTLVLERLSSWAVDKLDAARAGISLSLVECAPDMDRSIVEASVFSLGACKKFEVLQATEALRPEVFRVSMLEDSAARDEQMRALLDRGREVVGAAARDLEMACYVSTSRAAHPVQAQPPAQIADPARQRVRRDGLPVT